MKLPGWAWALLAVPFLGAAVACALLALKAMSPWPALEAAVFGGVSWWLLLRAKRPRSHTGSRVELEVPATVGLGGGFPVRARLFLASRLPLNPHRQRVRFVIEEQWISVGDEMAPSAVVHDEVLPVHAPADTVGEWETTVTPHVPLHAPTSFESRLVRLHAWLEFSVPYGMFGELKVQRPVVIVPELAQ